MGDVHFCLLWHHHQPCYREGPEGAYAMPWVRLHGIKDYYGMAWLARQHPEVHLTFNLVPSLIAQLDDYAAGTAQEAALRLTAKPAADLTPTEVQFLLNEFFHANRDTMMRPHPRYYELLMKRRFGTKTASQVATDFSQRDLLDLQVWATLAWFFPRLLRDDPVLRALLAKGRYFTEDDKAAMLAKQREVLAAIVPLYRALQDRGSAELTTSPFYHPILPLLCRMESAREALPKLTLPRRVADFAEDARAQVSRAVESHRAHFGRAPRGMWPSEGAVSPDIPPLASEAGIHWIATDEGILCRSLGCAFHRDSHGLLAEWSQLYQPYRVAAGSADVAIIFRDRVLSDLIGFQYCHRPPQEAARDFVARLLAIRKAADGKDTLVPVILDGENAWEYYRNSGEDFLHELYSLLGSTPGIRPLTVSEALEALPPRATLPRLFPGSWINSDFGVWIGHAEDRRAWELLATVRDFLAAHAAATPDTPGLAAAWDELYVAEGSDWFWWYGDDRSSLQDAEFDRLFRQHLGNVYRLLGERVPDELAEPISQPHTPLFRQPTAFIRPAVDGSGGGFFDWAGAGLYVRTHDSGVMQQGTPDAIQRVHFGFDEREFYLRLDFAADLLQNLQGPARVLLCFSEPRDLTVEIGLLGSPPLRVRLDGHDAPECRAAQRDVLEVACPFDVLGFRPREAARFHVRLMSDGVVVERAPRAGVLAFEVPTPDFEREMWQA